MENRRQLAIARKSGPLGNNTKAVPFKRELLFFVETIFFLQHCGKSDMLGGYNVQNAGIH